MIFVMQVLHEARRARMKTGAAHSKALKAAAAAEDQT